MRSTLSLLRATAIATALALPATATFTVAPGTAVAQSALPAPHVSRALDALLLPVNDAVRATFGLAPDAMGVFVLATAPGGLADTAGVLPGDVLDYVQGTEILSPADLDAIIWNWLNQGVTDYTFDGIRAGAAVATTTVITVEYWEETVEITEISSWSSYSSESFSYEEYTAEYSEEISASYEEQSFEATEESVDETATDEMAAEDEGATEADCAGEVIDGVCADEALPEEEVIDEGAYEGGDEEIVDEGGGDEGGDEEIVE